MFVLDAEHHVVDRLLGYSGGDPHLEGAILDVVGH
jgi:hypothetical protein